MNFLNFITATQTMLNFKLASAPTSSAQRIPNIIEPSAFRKVTSTQMAPQGTDLPQEAGHSFDQIMQERQRLINQYLQLNIQMLEKEIQEKEKKGETNETKTAPPLGKSEEVEGEGEVKQKKIKKMISCGHEDRPHYAKGMCSNCYHRYGRVKKPWRCNHEKLYAAGMCQNCYINDYNRKRREECSRGGEDVKMDTSSSAEHPTCTKGSPDLVQGQ